MQNLKVGDVFRGRYVLSSMLGRGGMGVVWRAHDRSNARDVALKFMASRLEGDALARKRFEREGKAAASLPSRHVVKVLDHGIEGSSPFLVMELLEGEDLATRLRRVDRLSLADAARVISEICRGLRRAHEVGLIHRDLKPANVFLAKEDKGEEVAKILDFGMVKTTASTFEQSVATESGTIVGSVHYASPEQAQGERDLDLRSDLWSVAALAFRAATGRLPFTGDALGVVVLAICTRPLPKATDVDPELPAALDGFFERAFQRDREGRFQSAIDLADAFMEAALGASAPEVPFSGMGRSTHLDGFYEEAAPTSVTSLAASTRIVDLGGEATRMLEVEESAKTVEEASPFGATASTHVLEVPPAEAANPDPLEGGTPEAASAGVAAAAAGEASEEETPPEPTWPSEPPGPPMRSTIPPGVVMFLFCALLVALAALGLTAPAP